MWFMWLANRLALEVPGPHSRPGRRLVSPFLAPATVK